MTHAATRMRSGEVDALRCFAMLSVIALHAHLLPFGWIGVWLFYAISGYVVTLSILDQHPGGTQVARLGGFLRRRVARIVPVYYAFIAVGLIVGATQGLRQDGPSLASLLLFFDNVTMIIGHGMIKGWPSGHLWTLSVEMQFYAVYGVALCLLPRRATVALLIGFVVLCPLARFAASFWLDAHDWPPLDAAYAVYAGPGLHFDTFAMGGLLAFARGHGLMERAARPVLLAGLMALAAYAAVYVGVNHVVRGQHGLTMFRNVISGILIGEHREVFLYSAIGLTMTGLVAMAATVDRWIQPLLGIRALQWIGEISYGGYLFHVLGLKAATLLLGAIGINAHGRGHGMLVHLTVFGIGCVITLVLAWLSYRWFEGPARRGLSGRTQTAPTAMPALKLDVL